jgi:hypothetical protein
MGSCAEASVNDLDTRTVALDPLQVLRGAQDAHLPLNRRHANDVFRSRAFV